MKIQKKIIIKIKKKNKIVLIHKEFQMKKENLKKKLNLEILNCIILIIQKKNLCQKQE